MDTGKTIRYYVLSVAPDMDHVKRGYFIRHRINDYDSANVLYSAFKRQGCVVYLEIMETVKAGTRAEGDIKKWWGE